MTSFSPDRARSWSWGMVTRMGRRILTPVEELAPSAHRLDAFDEEVEMRRRVHEVQPLRVDDEEQAFVVVEEKARVRLGKAAQVILVHALFHGRAAAPHARDQRV